MIWVKYLTFLFTEKRKCDKLQERRDVMSLYHEHARMTIDMPFEEHKRLKAMAAFMGLSLKDLVLNCLRDHLLSDNVPNDETLKAFKETDDGKGLMHCKDFNEFIEKLGIK